MRQDAANIRSGILPCSTERRVSATAAATGSPCDLVRNLHVKTPVASDGTSGAPGAEIRGVPGEAAFEATRTNSRRQKSTGLFNSGLWKPTRRLVNSGRWQIRWATGDGEPPDVKRLRLMFGVSRDGTIPIRGTRLKQCHSVLRNGRHLLRQLGQRGNNLRVARTRKLSLSFHRLDKPFSLNFNRLLEFLLPERRTCKDLAQPATDRYHAAYTSEDKSNDIVKRRRIPSDTQHQRQTRHCHHQKCQGQQCPGRDLASRGNHGPKTDHQRRRLDPAHHHKQQSEN